METIILSKDGLKKVNLNRRKAIRERCLNCLNYSFVEVDKCQFKECALYPYRLGVGKQNAKERDRSIRFFCSWCNR